VLRAFPSPGPPRPSRLGRPANAANDRFPQGRKGARSRTKRSLIFSTCYRGRPEAVRASGGQPALRAPLRGPDRARGQGRHVAGSSVWHTCRSAALRRVRLVSLAEVIQACFKASAPRQPKARRRGGGTRAFRSPFPRPSGRRRGPQQRRQGLPPRSQRIPARESSPVRMLSRRIRKDSLIGNETWREVLSSFQPC
jgi:hypothetical protein